MNATRVANRVLRFDETRLAKLHLLGGGLNSGAVARPVTGYDIEVGTVLE